MDEEVELTLKLKLSSVNLALKGIQMLPMYEVNALVADIMRQAQEQIKQREEQAK